MSAATHQQKVSALRLVGTTRTQASLRKLKTLAPGVIDELVESGYLSKDEKAKSFTITAAGVAFRDGPAPPPEGFDDILLPYQKNYLRMKLFLADGGAMTFATIRSSLDTVTAKRQLAFGSAVGEKMTVNAGLLVWMLDDLVRTQDLEKAGSGDKATYTLTEAGEERLAADPPYETIRYTLTGGQLGRLMELVKAGGDVAPTPTEKPVTKPVALSPEQVMSLYEELASDEKYRARGVLPLHDFRQEIRRRFDPSAATHEALDETLKTLRQERRIKLIAIGDTSRVSKESLDDGIYTDGEILYSIEVAYEHATVG